jgi:Domain of unknown function (DUF4350)
MSTVAGRLSAPGATDAASAWRRWRVPAVLVATILLGGVVIALLAAGAAPGATGALDPRDAGPYGTRALAALLAGQGKTVIRVETADAAVAQSQHPGTAIVIGDSGGLDSAALVTLGNSTADLVIVAPGQDALYALAPGVIVATGAPASVTSRQPQCALRAARLAGSASMGGQVFSAVSVRSPWLCYRVSPPAAHHPPGAGAAASLVRFQSGGHIVTVLGTGDPLTNADLGQDGNAALALNLLGEDSRIVWLVPVLGTGTVPGGQVSSGPGLIPGQAYLVIAELAVALILAALWRMRRFGPLVFEPLPVVVRAGETVEGHGRLYRSRRARDRAAAALRNAALARITTRIGLPQEASPEAACQELASRTGRDAADLQAMLYGPEPGDDAALVTLATDLDSLEGQVLTQ